MEHWGLLGPASPPNRFNHSTNPCSRSAVPALSGCESAPRPPTLVGFVWASRGANRRDEFAFRKDKDTRPGKRLHNYGKSSFLIGKSTISMVIFKFANCKRLQRVGKGMPRDAKGQRCHGDAHLLSSGQGPGRGRAENRGALIGEKQSLMLKYKPDYHIIAYISYP